MENKKWWVPKWFHSLRQEIFDVEQRDRKRSAKMFAELYAETTRLRKKIEKLSLCKGNHNELTRNSKGQVYCKGCLKEQNLARRADKGEAA